MQRDPFKPRKNSDTGVCLKPAGDSHSSTARSTPFLSAGGEMEKTSKRMATLRAGKLCSGLLFSCERKRPVLNTVLR